MLILGIDTSGRQGSVALLQAPEEAQGGSAAHRRTRAPQRRPILRAAGARHRRTAATPRPGEALAWRSSPLPAAPVRSPDCAWPLPPSRDWPRPWPSRSSPSPCWRRSCWARAAEGRAVAAIDAQRGEVFFGEFVAGHLRERDRRPRRLVSALAAAQCRRQPSDSRPRSPSASADEVAGSGVLLAVTQPWKSSWLPGPPPKTSPASPIANSSTASGPMSPAWMPITCAAPTPKSSPRPSSAIAPGSR